MTIRERYDRLTAKPNHEWLVANEHIDPSKLLLSPPAHLADIKADLADQLSARKKARKKLPAWYENVDVLWPPPLSIEQASSEITARFKAGLIKGTFLTDLTGGTGIDLLAFSDHFDQVTYVEQNEWLCKVFRHNATCFAKSNITIHHSDAESQLDQLQEGQWVYIDPARRGSQQQKVFLLDDCSPNLLQILPKITEKKCSVLVKLSPILDIQHVLTALNPYRLIVLSVQNEVKELLAFINKAKTTTSVIETVGLVEETSYTYSFDLSQEYQRTVEYQPVGNYLYEPNAAVLKAGAFKSIAQDYNLFKLHPNTHLYTSEDLIDHFPGRAFSVLREVSGSTVKSEFRKKNLHVITRNYPQNASTITKKYQLSESGDQYLIAATDHQGKKKMFLTKKV